MRRAMCSGSRLGAASPRSNDWTPPSNSEQQQPQDACADPVARQGIAQLLQQTRCGLQHVLLAQDRLEEGGAGVIGGRRQDGDQRLGRAPQGLIEAAQELGLEARGKWGARLVDELADALEAEPAHERLRCLRQPECGERQIPQSAAFLTRCHDPVVGVTDGAPSPRTRRPYRRLPCAGRARTHVSVPPDRPAAAPRHRGDARSP